MPESDKRLEELEKKTESVLSALLYLQGMTAGAKLAGEKKE